MSIEELTYMAGKSDRWEFSDVNPLVSIRQQRPGDRTKDEEPSRNLLMGQQLYIRI